jgi:hypothetical protein
MKDLLNLASTAPGRYRSYVKNREIGREDLLPYSCKLRKYSNCVGRELVSTSRDLRHGAGVKLVLDDYIDPTPTEVSWLFYLPDSHPDFSKITEHQAKFLSPSKHLPRYKTLDVQDSMEFKNLGSI